MDCPACGKSNLAAESNICSRCGCDLSRLHDVMKSASRHIQQAIECMQRREWESALQNAERSWRLRHLRLSARLAFLASAAFGDTDSAARWHAAASRCSDT